MLLPSIFATLLGASLRVQCVSTQAQQNLRNMEIVPTSLVQFVPLVGMTSPILTAGAGFVNSRVTNLYANLNWLNTHPTAGIQLQLVNNSHYSHEINVFLDPVSVITSMSCSGAPKEAFWTCIWTVESSASTEIIDAHTNHLSTATWTITNSYDQSSAYVPSTFTSVLPTYDHLQTINIESLIRLRTSTTASATSTVPLKPVNSA